MIAVFLFYGLAFFGLGLAATLYLRQGSDLPLRNQLPWLAAFDFSYAAIGWLDMFLSTGMEPELAQLIQTIRMILQPTSGLMLLLGLYRPLFALRYIALFVGVGWLGLTAVFLKPFSDETVTNQSVSKSTPL
ncbi:MAG: hypothetical protein DWQ04_29530 [Chloroflexi bacterium]|nr:MAG: hypothetical protein DWQ04_29530 [Chloroflexota bacterium]